MNSNRLCFWPNFHHFLLCSESDLQFWCLSRFSVLLLFWTAQNTPCSFSPPLSSPFCPRPPKPETHLRSPHPQWHCTVFLSLWLQHATSLRNVSSSVDDYWYCSWSSLAARFGRIGNSHFSIGLDLSHSPPADLRPYWPPDFRYCSLRLGFRSF